MAVMVREGLAGCQSIWRQNRRAHCGRLMSGKWAVGYHLWNSSKVNLHSALWNLVLRKLANSPMEKTRLVSP